MNRKRTSVPADCLDVIIIGAGVVGCAIARELSRYHLRVSVLERENDVAGGASGRNSGVVHAGFNNPAGSLKARFCVEGNAGFAQVCRDLAVPFRKTGKLVTALDDSDRPALERLRQAGERNGVPGLEIIEAPQIKQLEPHVSGVAALFSGSTAVTSPFLFTVALAENAARNGVVFHFATRVTGISRSDNLFRVRAGRRDFHARVVINSAGLQSDRIAGLVGINDYRLYPCRGQYHILDRQASEWLKMPVYPVPRPESGGLGVHLTPTVEGNILIGPSAEFIGSRADHAVTRTVMRQLFAEARELLPMLSPKLIIRSYSGIRAKLTPPGQGSGRDFVIEDSPTVPGFINLIGIESPGLTSAVPIGKHVADMVGNHLPLRPKADFLVTRPPASRFSELANTEKAQAIATHPDIGEIVCRCEQISRQEILDAIANPLGVKTLAGIKYRARAMMGRCQGGYCLTRIVEMLHREFKVPLEEILERNGKSQLFTGPVKGARR
jgi:glycerol-3-phosphate dehydrogenase